MSAVVPDRVRWIEFTCFAALAAFGAFRWTALVADPPAGRVALVVLLATAAGAAYVAIATLELPRRTRWALGATAAAAALCIGMVVVGLPARLLLPDRWSELYSNVEGSLDGIMDIHEPYTGADPWIRLVILLAAPLVLAIAAWAAFWPTRRRTGGRILALALLVSLYLVPVAWGHSDNQLAVGVLLLALVCAWLWLPELRPGSHAGALVAVGAAAVIAIPTAAAVDPGRALVDYRGWGLLSESAVSFQWDQSYGPLQRPQNGTLLLVVASDQTHYWKATNLESFNGISWERSVPPANEPSLGQPFAFHPKLAKPRRVPEWIDRINLDVRGLSSPIAIGAGTVLALNGLEGRPALDAVWDTEHELGPGDSYTALVYDPKPSPAEMNRAGTAYPAEARRYVSFSLTGGAAGGRSLEAPFWSRSGPAAIAREVRGTAYEGMYDLARGLTAGAVTPYVAARRIELHLRANYTYRENVPSHDFPLPAFLSVDRAGYCQQFSGAMALMLRMLGIPSRVATGFAPGGREPRSGLWVVSDTDAHDWVEVFFPRIGWVTFDPTPQAAPAATALDGYTVRVGEFRPGSEVEQVRDAPAQRSGEDAPAPQPTATPSDGPGQGSSPEGAPLVGGVTGAAAIAALSAYGYRRRRRSRLDPETLVAAEIGEIERALDRFGAPLPPGGTLRKAESRLERLAGAEGAAYAAKLREWRYRDANPPPPGPFERRALRRALLRAAGWRSAIRALLAIPPGGPTRR